MSKFEYLSKCIKLSAWYVLPISLITWQGLVVGTTLYVVIMKLVESLVKLIFNQTFMSVEDERFFAT